MHLRAAAPGATVKENRIFVEDRCIWTRAGITSGIDLALHLISRLRGPEPAMAVSPGDGRLVSPLERRSAAFTVATLS